MQVGVSSELQHGRLMNWDKLFAFHGTRKRARHMAYVCTSCSSLQTGCGVGARELHSVPGAWGTFSAEALPQFLTWLPSWRPSFPALLLSSCSPPCPNPAFPGGYQGATAQQDHEDDEALEPAVFHDLVAGLAQSPPDLPWGLCGVHCAAGTAPDTA